MWLTTSTHVACFSKTKLHVEVSADAHSGLPQCVSVRAADDDDDDDRLNDDADDDDADDDGGRLP